MTGQTNKVHAAGALLHLVSFGLVAVGIAISFGGASLSLLGISKETTAEARRLETAVEFAYARSAVVPYIYGPEETLLASRRGESAMNFPYTGSAVVPYIDRHGASGMAEIKPPNLVEAAIPRWSPAQGPPVSAIPTEEAGSTSNFEPPPEHDASAISQEISPASSIPSPSTAETHLPELSEPQQAKTKDAPTAAEVTVTPGESASRTIMPAAATPDKDRNRLFRNVPIEHPAPATLDQANAASHEPARAQQLQTMRSYDHILSPDAAFRYGMRKECGPINDPELRRHCIASFSAHYR